jgi:hypothetical protein
MFLRNVACALLIGAVNTMAAASSLPKDPILDQGVPPCHSYEFLEGSDQCAYFEKLGEPPYPVTRPDETKLAFRLTRGIGERVPVITLRIEILDDNRALLKAYEATPNGGILFEGLTWLGTPDVARILAAADRYGFWSLPEKVSYAPHSETKDGMETVVICMSGLTIAGIKSGARHVVDRQCPEGNNDEKPLGMWHDLLRIAHAHFPDLAADKYWQAELN